MPVMVKIMLYNFYMLSLNSFNKTEFCKMGILNSVRWLSCFLLSEINTILTDMYADSIPTDQKLISNKLQNNVVR
jgi:hypothetical protein